MKRSPDPFWRVFALCGGVNFVVFVVISLVLGGDALGTTAIGGHYFLASHGRLTEVSRGVWIYSWAHAFITVTTLPTVMIVGLIHELMHPRSPERSGRPRPTPLDF